MNVSDKKKPNDIQDLTLWPCEQTLRAKHFNWEEHHKKKKFYGMLSNTSYTYLMECKGVGYIFITSPTLKPNSVSCSVSISTNKALTTK
jgi:hypothetical protein